MTTLKLLLQKNMKPYTKYIPDINKPTIRSMLKLSVAFLENNKYSKEAFDKEVTKLKAQYPDGPKDYDIYCTIVMILVETFMKSKKSGDELSESLRELKFKDEVIEDLTKVLITNQAVLFEQFQEIKIVKPFSKFEYRINISLMESGQPPTVILHFEHKGEMKTVNLSLMQFHRLRLTIASALAELQALEGKRT